MRKKQKRDYFVSCVVAAGGSGSRMQADINKIFLDLHEVPVLAHTLMTLDDHEEIDELILVTAEQDIPGCRDIQEEFNIRKLKVIVRGGSTRQESVRKGLAEVAEEARIVLIHDAARPLIAREAVQRVIDAALAQGAAAAGVPCKNTVKLTDNEGFITDTPDRSRLYEIQTPQGFHRDLIMKAHEQAAEAGLTGTDDCYLAEQLGAPVKIVEGDYRNIKITTPEDLLLAELLLNLG